jgi:FkbM family methyltransferase
MADDHPGALTREHVVWAYRLLLDREPESEDVIGPKLAGSHDTRELRRHLMTSAEFQEKNRDYAHTNDTTVVIKELDGAGGARLFVDLADHLIGLGIVRGRYEEDEIAFVRRSLAPGDNAIDVGAHVGLFTMHMAERVGPGGRVYAFEPFPANAGLLKRSIAENRYDDRIVFRQAAVGAASGTATLTFPRETLNTGGAYLLREGSIPAGGNLRQDVPLVALDRVDIRRPVRLIKMDVEGAEPLVLQGARELIAADRPLILSEVHPAQLDRTAGLTPAAYVRLIDSIGYRAHRLEHGKVGDLLTEAPAEVTSIVLLPA